MDIFWYVVVFCFGAILGSFLNVVIYRLHTGKSLNGHSHCLSCGERLSPWELFPLFSYVVLRARCKHCSSRIPPRYFLVELVTGVSLLTLYILMSSNIVLFILHAILILILIVIAVYDIRHTIIPDELVIVGCVIALMFLGLDFYEQRDAIFLLKSGIAGLLAALFIGTLWYVSKGRWIGLGDAKLAFPLGTIVGLSGVFSMIVLSFWAGALISLFLLLLQHVSKKGKTTLLNQYQELTIKSEIPFAPFLIIGFLLVQLFHADIFNITFALFWFLY